MSDYKRFVSYIYGYKQGEKGESTGFVKVNARGGECRIWVHVRGFYTHHQEPYRVYAFKQKKEGLEGQYLGELESRNGALEWDGVTKTDSLMGGFSLEESRGIYIEGGNRIYAAEWDDYPVDTKRFVLYPEGGIRCICCPWFGRCEKSGVKENDRRREIYEGSTPAGKESGEAR